jgi:hypothetical protein
VVHHILLANARRRWWLVPEVHPVDRLVDFPLDVTGVDTLDEHMPTVGPS